MQPHPQFKGLSDRKPMHTNCQILTLAVTLQGPQNMVRVFKTGINTQHSPEAIAKQNLKEFAKKIAALRPLSHLQGINSGHYTYSCESQKLI